MAADEKREAAAGHKRKNESGSMPQLSKVTKKRRIFTPKLRDESSSDNIAELSRPARQIETKYKENIGLTAPRGRTKSSKRQSAPIRTGSQHFYLARSSRQGYAPKIPSKAFRRRRL
ncbi:hypothetical protein B0H14DRAFT_2559100 [Mycena olivaceomarginata]|nr:hypothetical protein B0H14DRAFT_2559100 [Mycena olivaceomarginata]